MSGFVCVQFDQGTHFIAQSTLVVISKTKGLSEILRDIRTPTYQICRIYNKKKKKKKKNPNNHIPQMNV